MHHSEKGVVLNLPVFALASIKNRGFKTHRFCQNFCFNFAHLSGEAQQVLDC